MVTFPERSGEMTNGAPEPKGCIFPCRAKLTTWI
jgi:hypothetical protein